MGLSLRLHANEICIFVFDLVVLGAVLLTVIPAYLIWDISTDIASPITAVPILAASLVAKSVSWFVVYLIVQSETFLGVGKGRVRPWCPYLHPVYCNCSDTYQEWSFARILWGSPLFGIFAWLLGASFEGRVLSFGDKIYDFPHVAAAGRTIVDSALVVGHNIVYERVRFGRIRVSGVIRQKTFAMAESSVSRKESGPWHAIAKSITTAKRTPGPKAQPTMTSLSEGA